MQEYQNFKDASILIPNREILLWNKVDIIFNELIFIEEGQSPFMLKWFKLKYRLFPE